MHFTPPTSGRRHPSHSWEVPKIIPTPHEKQPPALREITPPLVSVEILDLILAMEAAQKKINAGEENVWGVMLADDSVGSEGRR